MATILLTFLAVFLLVASGGLLLSYREALLRRLASVASTPAESSESWLRSLIRTRSTASLAKAVDPFQKVLPRSSAEISVMQRRARRRPGIFDT